ncbi:MAG: fibro-slime domain-containing protein [Fibrobacteria bacterium]|nr:fibro-slime domain-containing protein [Fibrobacteria bacterium]
MTRIRGLGLLLGIAMVLGIPSSSMAGKTLMFLMDEYIISNTDSVAGTPQVWIQHYDSAAANVGYYYGAKDLFLTQTDAYAKPIPVHSAEPDSIPYPRQLERWWYSLPDFNSAQFREGKVRLTMQYMMVMHRWLNGNPSRMQIDTQSNRGNSTTSELNTPTSREIDNCIDTLHGDTIWIRHTASDNDSVGTISNNPSAASMRCYDHNPFFKKVGTVHVLNPWPGKTVWAQVGTEWYPLYAEPGRAGWVTASLWQDPRTAAPFVVRFANGDPRVSSAVTYMDAGGLAGNASGIGLDFTANAGKSVWVIPPTGALPAPTVSTVQPAKKLTLMIHRPAWNASAVRVMWKGMDARFIASSTEYCDWFSMDFYEGAVPEQIVLRQPFVDSLFGQNGLAAAPALMSNFTDWITVNPVLAASGTLWLETDGNRATFLGTAPATATICNEKILAFSAWDFSKIYNPYKPFTEGLGYKTDNCPTSGGKETKGLVLPTLNSKGVPTWSGKVDCNIGNTLDGPQYWFDTLVRGGVPMNSFTCVPLPLTLDATGYYKYSNPTFFPLDTFTTLRDGTPNRFNDKEYNSRNNNFGFCMHAKASFEYVPGLQFRFRGDDDVWVFIDKKLAMDIGGQHGPVDGDIKLDNLGLSEGKSYQFDMFYCERHELGSSILIQTTMNLVPTIDVEFDSSGAKPGVYDYISWIKETTNRADICPELGAATATNKRRGPAIYTLVSPDLTEITLDSLVATQYPGLVITDLNSHIAIDTAALKKSGRLVTSGLYQIRINVGSEERIVPFTISSDAVQVFGVLLDRNGDGQPDSVVLKTDDQAASFRVPVSATLRWADRSGVPDSVSVPSTNLHKYPGDSTLTGGFLLPSRTSCPPAGCTGNMGAVYTANGGDTVYNPIVELRDGMAPVADSAWLIYDSTGLGKDTLFVIASEALVATMKAALPVGDSAFVLTGRSIAARPVPGTAILVGNLLKLPIDPATNPIQPGDSIRLGGWSGDVFANSPRELSRWVPLYANPVAKSWMLDVDGNGAPDSVGIMVRGTLRSATAAKIHWKTAAGVDTVIQMTTPTGIGTGLRLPPDILANATLCTGCFMEVTMGGVDQRIVLLDSVPAVALSAKLRYGVSKDTLLVEVSEPFAIGNAPGEGTVAVKAAGSASIPGTLVAGQATAGPRWLTLVVDTGAVQADSVRLRAWILGNLNVPVGAVSPYVPLVYGPQPISVALFDRNGDGKADWVRFHMVRSATGAPNPAGFAVSWAGAVARAASLPKSADGRTWSGPIGPLPFGTACDAGCLGWVTTIAGDSLSFRSAVEDSVPPVAVSARLGYGLAGDPDTLDVTASEPLLAGAAGAWVETGTNRSLVHGTLVATPSSSSVQGKRMVLLVPSGTVSDGDSLLRLGARMGDSGRAFVGDTSAWVPLASSVKGVALLLDSDQDGAPDSIQFDVRGRLAAGSARIGWSEDASGKADVVVPSGMAGSWGGPLVKALPVGATSCQVSAGCTVTLADGTVLPLLDGVPPVATKARYRFGANANDPDTLIVDGSETLQLQAAGNAWLDWGIPGTRREPVPSLQAGLVNSNPRSIVALVRLPEGVEITATHAGFAVAPQLQGFADLLGNQPGTFSPMVPIEFGPPPMIGVLADRNGDGYPEGVRFTILRKTPAPPAADSFTVRWNDEKGTPLTRRIAASSLTWDGSTSWVGDLATPFPYGATSCLGSCGGAALDPAGASLPLRTLIDSIPPVPVQASYRYSLPEEARDTLRVVLSEPWANPDPNNSRLTDAIVALGGAGNSNPLTSALSWSLAEDGKTLIFVLDPMKTVVGAKDSVRLVGLPTARVHDAASNAPGAVAPWFPIDFGLRPPWLYVGPWPGFIKRPADEVWSTYPAGTPPLTVEWRPVKGSSSNPVPAGDWKLLAGSGPDSSRSLGLLLNLNRPVDGHLYIYDNIGIHVTDISLDMIAKAWADGGSPDASRQVVIRWKGIDKTGALSSPGVYLWRLILWQIPDDPHAEKEITNTIYTFGWAP